MGSINSVMDVFTKATGVGYLYNQVTKPAKDANKAADEAKKANDAAIQNVKDAQAGASNQAQKALKARSSAGTQTVFTSPLGITQQANTSRKVLLGQ